MKKLRVSFVAMLLMSMATSCDGWPWYNGGFKASIKFKKSGGTLTLKGDIDANIIVIFNETTDEYVSAPAFDAYASVGDTLRATLEWLTVEHVYGTTSVTFIAAPMYEADSRELVVELSASRFATIRVKQKK